MVTSSVDRPMPTIITTGNNEIDSKMGGGIPMGSLTLIEGQSAAGKSVISQQMTHGALVSGVDVVYYTTENTVKSLLTQMNSLNLDVTDYFLMDFLRIYRLQVSSRSADSQILFGRLADHIEKLPESFKMIVIDSATILVTHGDEVGIMDFFQTCKELCNAGRTIFLVVHTHAFEESMLIRVRSMCDAHLNVRLEEMGSLLVKLLEVTKVRNADRSTGNIISFDVEPGLGIKIIPISRAKA